MNSKQHIKSLSYLLCDYLAALLAWSLFFVFRKLHIEPQHTLIWSDIAADSHFWLGLLFIPMGWIVLYALFGAYRRVDRKARLRELGETLSATAIGVMVLFFVCMLDDVVKGYSDYFADLFFLFTVHFFLTYLPRFILTSRTVRLIHCRKLGFPAIIIGSGTQAYATYLDLMKQEVYTGNIFVGFVTTDGGDEPDSHNPLLGSMPCLGSVADIRQLVLQYSAEEVIIALDSPAGASPSATTLKQILSLLATCGDIIIKITPNCHNLVVGSVKVDNLFHSPLVVIDNRLMPEWQYSLKRLFDIAVSLFVLVVFSPLYLVTAIIVKLTSPGPVFYTQQRVGLGGKPFSMHKFRSMYVDSEAAGPALSTDNDPRITPFGRFMRKVRLDEIPQFYNVLKGTMSLVGPRPERQYYIDQIVQQAPDYLLLQRVRPGITSWGQVKYGYASTVEEMVERFAYDRLYLDNMSLATDIKILLYTVIIIIQGRGK